MAKKKNRNIVLLKTMQDLQNEIDYENFEYKEIDRNEFVTNKMCFQWNGEIWTEKEGNKM